MIKQIKQLVEVETGLKDISDKSRKREYVEARAIYFKLAREHTTKPFSTISKLINRDHSTGVHAIKLYNTWKELPKLYIEELYRYRSVEKQLLDIKEDIQPSPNELIVIYKKKNYILELEVIKLKEEIKTLKEELI